MYSRNNIDYSINFIPVHSGIIMASDWYDNVAFSAIVSAHHILISR